MKKAKKDEEIEFTVGAEDLQNLKVEVDASEVERQITELTNDLQRTRADFENFRKQAQLATVYKVLPLLDDLDRAINSYAELKPLSKSLEKTLKELNLTKIPSNEGVEFNPSLHDAVMVEGDGEKETIAETLRPGYFYEGEILRQTMVKVKKE